jgi:hypothetical protein
MPRCSFAENAKMKDYSPQRIKGTEHGGIERKNAIVLYFFHGFSKAYNRLCVTAII